MWIANISSPVQNTKYRRSAKIKFPQKFRATRWSESFFTFLIAYDKLIIYQRPDIAENVRPDLRQLALLVPLSVPSLATIQGTAKTPFSLTSTEQKENGHKPMCMWILEGFVLLRAHRCLKQW